MGARRSGYTHRAIRRECPHGVTSSRCRGGGQPRWRRDGKELFYLAPDGKLMAVAVTAGAGGIETSSPRELFNTGIVASIFQRRNQYVVTRDGQQIESLMK